MSPIGLVDASVRPATRVLAIAVIAALAALAIVASSRGTPEVAAEHVNLPRWEYGILVVQPLGNGVTSWEFHGPDGVEKKRTSARELVDALGARTKGALQPAALNALGELGWQLVSESSSVTGFGDRRTWTFLRPRA